MDLTMNYEKGSEDLKSETSEGHINLLLGYNGKPYDLHSISDNQITVKIGNSEGYIQDIDIDTSNEDDDDKYSGRFTIQLSDPNIQNLPPDVYYIEAWINVTDSDGNNRQLIFPNGQVLPMTINANIVNGSNAMPMISFDKIQQNWDDFKNLVLQHEAELEKDIATFSDTTSVFNSEAASDSAYYDTVISDTDSALASQADSGANYIDQQVTTVNSKVQNIDDMVESAKGAIATAANGVYSIVNSDVDSAENDITTTTASANSDTDSTTASAETVIDNAADGVVDTVNNTVNSAEARIDNAADGIRGEVDSMVSSGNTEINNTADNIQSIVTSAVNDMTDTASGVDSQTNSAVDNVNYTVNSADNNMSEFASGIDSRTDSAVARVDNDTNSGVDNIYNSAQSVYTGINSSADSVYSKIYSSGEGTYDIIKYLATSADSNISSVTASVYINESNSYDSHFTSAFNNSANSAYSNLNDQIASGEAYLINHGIDTNSFVELRNGVQLKDYDDFNKLTTPGTYNFVWTKKIKNRPEQASGYIIVKNDGYDDLFQYIYFANKDNYVRHGSFDNKGNTHWGNWSSDSVDLKRTSIVIYNQLIHDNNELHDEIKNNYADKSTLTSLKNSVDSTIDNFNLGKQLPNIFDFNKLTKSGTYNFNWSDNIKNNPEKVSGFIRVQDDTYDDLFQTIYYSNGDIIHRRGSLNNGSWIWTNWIDGGAKLEDDVDSMSTQLSLTSATNTVAYNQLEYDEELSNNKINSNSSLINTNSNAINSLSNGQVASNSSAINSMSLSVLSQFNSLNTDLQLGNYDFNKNNNPGNYYIPSYQCVNGPIPYTQKTVGRLEVKKINPTWDDLLQVFYSSGAGNGGAVEAIYYRYRYQLSNWGQWNHLTNEKEVDSLANANKTNIIAYNQLANNEEILNNKLNNNNNQSAFSSLNNNVNSLSNNTTNLSNSVNNLKYGKQLPQNSDFNQLSKIGVYNFAWSDNISNCPEKVSGYIQVQDDTYDDLFQIIHYSNGDVFHRNGSIQNNKLQWNSWIKSGTILNNEINSLASSANSNYQSNSNNIDSLSNNISNEIFSNSYSDIDGMYNIDLDNPSNMKNNNIIINAPEIGQDINVSSGMPQSLLDNKNNFNQYIISINPINTDDSGIKLIKEKIIPIDTDGNMGDIYIRLYNPAMIQWTKWSIISSIQP